MYLAPTLDDFIRRAFVLVPRFVPCDFVSAMYRRAGDRLLKERDSLGRTWSPAFMRRYAELTPAIPAVLANPGIKILTSRGNIPASDAVLHRTAFYREIMRAQGWRHAAVMCFWADPPTFPILVLALYRRSRQPDFSRADITRLERLHDDLALGVRRFHELASLNAVTEGMATTLRLVSSGVVVLDWRLTVVRANRAGTRACEEWNRRSGSTRGRDESTLPAAVLKTCLRLRHELESLVRRHPDTAQHRECRISHPSASHLHASLIALRPADGIAEPTFVVRFEQQPVTADTHTTESNVLQRLTQSERDVALVVADGSTNEEIAERLGKSVHAVKFLLHRVYSKLDVPNRARLALLLRQG